MAKKQKIEYYIFLGKDSEERLTTMKLTKKIGSSQAEYLKWLHMEMLDDGPSLLLSNVELKEVLERLQKTIVS